MGARDRLKQLEKAADEHTTVLTCRDTGEKIRVPEDAGVRLVVADWHGGVGKEQEDPLVDWLSPYLERGLLDEQGCEWPIGDVGGGLRGLTG
jgi:DICT domain-containing protein